MQHRWLVTGLIVALLASCPLAARAPKAARKDAPPKAAPPRGVTAGNPLRLPIANPYSPPTSEQSNRLASTFRRLTGTWMWLKVTSTPPGSRAELGFGNRSRRNPISTHFRDATGKRRYENARLHLSGPYF